MSRLHLRIFATHLGIIGLANLPLLVVQPPLHLVFIRLAMMFSLCATCLAVLASLGRHRMLGGSLGLWDEVLALMLMSLGFSILLRMAA